MCGLYGFIGKPTRKTTGIIKTLGILNEGRGKDSTGIAIVHDNRVTLKKDTVPSTEFFEKQQIIEQLCKYRKEDFLIIMGHTRAKTRGAITQRNAHPFRKKNILFSHNGIIHNFDTLQEKFKTNYQVDSEIIGHLLQKKMDMNYLFDKLGGYYAVPFINLKDPTTLHVALHSQIFNFAYTHNQLYYSSRQDDLEEALGQYKDKFKIVTGRHNIVYTFYRLKDGIQVSQKYVYPKTTHSTYSYTAPKIEKPQYLLIKGEEWFKKGNTRYNITGVHSYNAFNDLTGSNWLEWIDVLAERGKHKVNDQVKRTITVFNKKIKKRKTSWEKVNGVWRPIK